MSTLTAPIETITHPEAHENDDATVALEWLTSITGPEHLDRTLDIPVAAYGGYTTREMLNMNPSKVRASLAQVLRTI